MRREENVSMLTFANYHQTPSTAEADVCVNGQVLETIILEPRMFVPILPADISLDK